jgi:hypothetical protein
MSDKSWIIVADSKHLVDNCVGLVNDKELVVIDSQLSLSFHSQRNTKRVIGISNVEFNSARKTLLEFRTPSSLIKDLNKRKFNHIFVDLNDDMQLKLDRQGQFTYERMPKK